MADPTSNADYGAWLLAASSAVGLLVSLFNYFSPTSGVDDTGGAALVVASTALLLGASLAVALRRGRPDRLRGTLIVLLVLGLIGTGAAAYFLEAGALIAAMFVGFAGWIIHVAAGTGRRAANFRRMS